MTVVVSCRRSSRRGTTDSNRLHQLAALAQKLPTSLRRSTFLTTFQQLRDAGLASPEETLYHGLQC